MRIAVLGGGNGSYAAMADLTEQGHEVRFWRRDAAALQKLRARGTIALKDTAGTRRIRPFLMADRIADAIAGAELIVVPTPAFAQADIARLFASCLEDGQVVFLPPGTFGSYAMAQIVKASGCRARVAFCETGTLPWLTRKHGADTIAITMRAKRLPTGVFPADLTRRTLAVVAKAFPCIEPVEDALSAALMNAGPVIHPPLIIMNAGPLGHSERFDIHAEGTQPSVRRVMDALDGERIAVRERLGYAPYHFPIRDHYETCNWMYGDAHDRLVDSGDWREKIDLTRHRYMTEDVKYGLAFLVSVAQWCGVETPIASGLLAIASAICGEDLRRGPRTIEALGLAGHDAAALKWILDHGAAA